MGIINNELILKSLASLIGKNTFVLDPASRPSLSIGGRDFALSSVSFDNTTGKLVYRVEDGRGKEISSAFGVRDLTSLSSEILGKLESVISGMARNRRLEVSERNVRKGRQSGSISKSL